MKRRSCRRRCWTENDVLMSFEQKLLTRKCGNKTIERPKVSTTFSKSVSYFLQRICQYIVQVLRPVHVRAKKARFRWTERKSRFRNRFIQINRIIWGWHESFAKVWEQIKDGNLKRNIFFSRSKLKMFSIQVLPLFPAGTKFKSATQQQHTHTQNDLGKRVLALFSSSSWMENGSRQGEWCGRRDGRTGCWITTNEWSVSSFCAIKNQDKAEWQSWTVRWVDAN